MKALKPGALIVVGYFSDGILWARQSQELGLRDMLKVMMGCTNGAFSHPDFPVRAGVDFTHGIIDVNYHWNTKSPATEDLRKRYLEAFGRPMSTHAILAYESVMIIAEALERARSIDKEAIRNALATISYPKEKPHMCLAGDIRFGERGENINALPVAMQVQRGKIVVVYPEEYKEESFIFPQP